MRVKQEMCLELTPKNLYRLMTGRLPLADSGLSISDKPVRGMTLVSFWRALLERVLTEKTLSMLLPADGTHPRIQSNLMNRTGANPTPRLLRSDLGTQLSPNVLLMLVSNCSEILTLWNYDTSRFRGVLNLFEEQCAKGDSFLTDPISHHLILLRSDYPLPFDGRHSPMLFRDSLRLAWNALYALMGPDMNGVELRRLRTDQQAAPAALWELLCSDQSLNGMLHSSVRFLGQLASSPLPEDKYVPLPLSPENLVHSIQVKKKLLLSGPGGSGKTQLAAQAFALMRQQSDYHTIAMMTVTGSLTDSFAALFPDQINSRAEDPLENIWASLDTPSVLLIIDGLDSPSGEEAILKKLRTLSCHLLLTGRIASLEGFPVISVPRMDEIGAVRLLTLSGREYFSKAEQHSLLSLSNLLGGHPLALRLIGSLCQTYYMTPAEMLSHLSSHGFQGLSLNTGKEQQELYALLDTLLIRTPLQPEERMLMRLLSMLPERTWRPSELSPYTVDFEKAGFSPADILERLSTVGLLQRELTGYLLHPVIAEVFRIPALRADEFPSLWAALRKDYEEKVNPKLQERFLMTLRIVQTTAEPNRDALAVLDRLCATVMTRPRWQAQPWMLEKYRTWLNRLPHSSMDEINLIACQMLWCTVLPWRDQLDGLAEELNRYDRPDMLEAAHYPLLVNMMEIGGSFIRRDRLLELLEKLRPPREPLPRLINYLNFLGGTQRGVLKDPDLALKTLQEAMELIRESGDLNSVECATNDTRTAYALADLRRYEEAIPLMVRVLSILKSKGYTDDSPTVSASRNALVFFRGKCSEKIAARDSLKQHLDHFEQAGHPVDDNYLAVLVNYGNILLDLYQLEEAEEVARKAVKLSRDLPVIGHLQLPHALVLLARVLQIQDHPAEALGYYMEADALFRKNYTRSNPHAMNCRKHLAETLIAVGQMEKGRRMLEEDA